jgi:hypothetical protein
MFYCFNNIYLSFCVVHENLHSLLCDYRPNTPHLASVVAGNGKNNLLMLCFVVICVNGFCGSF